MDAGSVVWFRKPISRDSTHDVRMSRRRSSVVAPQVEELWRPWERGIVKHRSEDINEGSVAYTIAQLMEDGEEGLETFQVTGNSNKPAELHLCNVTGQASVETNAEIEDLTTLTHLHEPEIIFALQLRYDEGMIYTATGPILLAVNPFKSLPIYGPKQMAIYSKWGEESVDGNTVGDPPPPHAYSIADKTFRAMTNRSVPLPKGGPSSYNQTILVSGESGAGKTETTKIIMAYLAQLSDSGRQTSVKEGDSMEDDVKPQEKVLRSNPVLEAFGNARTVRNDNSSRFGKFIELQFDTTKLKSNKFANKAHDVPLIGASVRTYLLEKVRVVNQSQDERNFHIFYMLCTGIEPEKRYDLHLGDEMDDFSWRERRYLNQSDCWERKDGVEDMDEFKTMLEAMNDMNFNESEREAALRVIAALLQLGDVVFEMQGEGGETTVAGGTGRVRAPSHTGARSRAVSSATISHTSIAPLSCSANLLKVDPEALRLSLCTRQIFARGESYAVKLHPDQATHARDAMAKMIYGNLFEWLVARINSSIEVGKTSSTQRGKRDLSFIGVLDIFGFESFQVNSFEQLCINYCNETLQQQFNGFVLQREQQEYIAEQIRYEFVEFSDSKACLELIEAKHTGIFATLHEQCLFPKATDQSFANKLYQNCTGHECFSADGHVRAINGFVVIHYAGPVCYATEGFLEKNMDHLSPEAMELLESSTDEFVKSLQSAHAMAAASSSAAPPRGRGASQANTANRRGSATLNQGGLGQKFMSSLAELNHLISDTGPHYVRCLKPNAVNRCDDFNAELLAGQLRCNGVLEAVKVTRSGFSNRFPHKEFVNTFAVLASGKSLPKAPKDAAAELFGRLASEMLENSRAAGASLSTADGSAAPGATTFSSPPTNEQLQTLGVQVGKTKVFLRQPAYQCLERLRNLRLRGAATCITSLVRGRVQSIKYRRLRGAAAVTVKAVRVFLAKAELRRRRQARDACKLIQAWRRGVVARRLVKELRRLRAAAKIQAWHRMLRPWKEFRRIVSAVTALQCKARVMRARVNLVEMRKAAKDLGNVQSERDELKNLLAAARNDLKKAMEQNQQLNEAPVKEVVVEVPVPTPASGSDEDVENWKKRCEELEEELKTSKESYENQIAHLKEEISFTKDKEVQRFKEMQALLDQRKALELQRMEEMEEEFVTGNLVQSGEDTRPRNKSVTHSSAYPALEDLESQFEGLWQGISEEIESMQQEEAEEGEERRHTTRKQSLDFDGALALVERQIGSTDVTVTDKLRAHAIKVSGAFPDVIQVGAGVGPSIYEQRLVAFYNEKNPEKIPEVPALLLQFKGREEEMFKVLVSKYGPSSVESGELASASDGVESGSAMSGDGQLNQLKDENKRLTSQLNFSETLMASTRDELEQAQQSMEELRKANALTVKDLNEVKQTLHRTTERASQLGQDLADSQARAKELDGLLNEWRALKSKMEAQEGDDVHDEGLTLEESRQVAMMARKEKDIAQARIIELQQSLETAHNERTSNSHRVQSMQEAYEEEKRKGEALQRKFDGLNDELRITKTNLTDARTRMREAESKVVSGTPSSAEGPVLSGDELKARRIDELQVEVQRLLDRLGDITAQHEKAMGMALDEQKERYEARIQELTVDDDGQQLDLRQLKSEIHSLKNDVSMLESNKASMGDLIDSMKADIAELRERVESARVAENRAVEARDEMKTTLDKVRNEWQTAQQQLQVMTSERDIALEHEKRVERMMHEWKEVEEGSQTKAEDLVNKRLTSLSDLNATLTAELEDLREQLAQAHRKIASVKSEASSVESERESLISKAAQLEERKKRLESDLTEADGDRQALREKVFALQASIREQVADFQAFVQESTEHMRKAKIGEMDGAVAKAMDDAIESAEQHARENLETKLKRMVDDARTTENNLLADVETRYRSEIDRLKEELERSNEVSQATVQRHQSTLQESTTEHMAELEKERNTFHFERSELQRRIADLNLELANASNKSVLEGDAVSVEDLRVCLGHLKTIFVGELEASYGGDLSIMQSTDSLSPIRVKLSAQSTDDAFQQLGSGGVRPDSELLGVEERKGDELDDGSIAESQRLTRQHKKLCRLIRGAVDGRITDLHENLTKTNRKLEETIQQVGSLEGDLMRTRTSVTGRRKSEAEIDVETMHEIMATHDQVEPDEDPVLRLICEPADGDTTLDELMTLEESSYDLSAKTANGERPIHLLCEHAHRHSRSTALGVLKLLLAFTDANDQRTDGATPLHLCLLHEDNWFLVLPLVMAGADINAQWFMPLANWTECVDPQSSRVYWYNEVTGEASWEMPSSATPMLPSAIIATKVDDLKGNPHERLAKDPDGRLSSLLGDVLAAICSPQSWVPDHFTDRCMSCNATFSLMNRRHHCRHCGRLICKNCQRDVRDMTAWAARSLLNTAASSQGGDSVRRSSIGGDRRTSFALTAENADTIRACVQCQSAQYRADIKREALIRSLGLAASQWMKDEDFRY